VNFLVHGIDVKASDFVLSTKPQASGGNPNETNAVVAKMPGKPSTVGGQQA
jgi:hypothetical protein